MIQVQHVKDNTATADFWQPSWLQVYWRALDQYFVWSCLISIFNSIQYIQHTQEHYGLDHGYSLPLHK